MRGMRYSVNQKRRALKMWLVEKVDVKKVAYRMKCDERTLWRWKSKYDGTAESLQNGSTVPHTPNPKSHTEKEVCAIKRIFDEYPDISYAEALCFEKKLKKFQKTTEKCLTNHIC